jgi:hypothetical protein
LFVIGDPPDWSPGRDYDPDAEGPQSRDRVSLSPRDWTAFLNRHKRPSLRQWAILKKAIDTNLDDRRAEALKCVSVTDIAGRTMPSLRVSTLR